MIGTLLIAAAFQAATQAPAPQAPPPREIAQGVHLISGAILPNYGPDGNTVIFDAPQGLVVVDTGRHQWHSDAILDFARTRNRPVAAIVNTHWHLDHSSGNGRLKAVYPQARVYTTRAVERVLAPGGFLVRDLEATRGMLDSADVPDAQKSEVRVFLATMDERNVLLPDVPIERSRRMRLAGRRLDVRVTDGAVTDADVWLYDRRTRLAVIGDLVTVPAPFFETACPDRWRAALDDVWATPFETVIPGHGAPMTRDQFNVYRTAFSAFIDCVRSDTAANQCSRAYAATAGTIVNADEARLGRIAANMDYYVGMLRQNGGKSRDCLSS